MIQGKENSMKIAVLPIFSLQKTGKQVQDPTFIPLINLSTLCVYALSQF